MIFVEDSSDRMYENMQADSRIDFATHSVNIYEKIHFQRSPALEYFVTEL